jgi:type I restriction enzyme R subunit
LSFLVRDARARGEVLGLSEDELAFPRRARGKRYSGPRAWRTDASDYCRELVRTVRQNVTIDWTLRENIRAQLRVLVKRILRKYGYPPDKQEKAVQTVLEQAALLSDVWASAA